MHNGKRMILEHSGARGKTLRASTTEDTEEHRGTTRGL
jgi:hypothetical protein